jgi:predicted RNA-binding protein with PIN domain
MSRVLIDGYNLIRQSPTLSASFESDPQTARQELIELLALYQRTRRHQVMVVFDGAGSIHLAPESTRRAGVKVVFSAQGQTADEVIARRADKGGEGTVVVTSDRELARACERAGAQVMSSPRFEAHLFEALTETGGPDEDDDLSPGRQTTRKKGPSRRAKKRDRQRERRLEKL